jgi:hypothetical protein
MGAERAQKPFAPLATGHVSCLLREGLRQFVVQGEDDGPLVGEVAIQERWAHPRSGRDIPQRRRFITTLAD